MSDVTNKRVNIFIDQTAAEVALDKLQQKANGFSKSIDDARKRQQDLRKEIEKGGDTKTTEKLEKQYKSLGKEIDATSQKLNENVVSINKVKDAIDKGLSPSIKQQENLVRSLRSQSVLLSKDTAEGAAKFKEYQKAKGYLEQLKTEMEGAAKVQHNWFTEAKSVAFGVIIGNTIQTAIQSIGGYISGIVSGNAKLSDSLAKVRQTTGLTDVEVKSLATSLRQIDTRTAQSELLKIAEIGGQFNVPKEQLKDFVQQIDKVNVVLGSEFGGGAEEITTEMSLLRNVFQDIKSDNISDDIGKISNAVVTLAQEGAATAPVISDFSKRISPLEATANLTSGAVLGLSATLQELAVNPERGGTAVVKLFDKMISNADEFAKVAGVTGQEFKKLVQEDSFGAFQKVLEGFKKGGDNVTALNGVVKDLEVSGVGAKEVLVKLSQNIDLLKNRTDLATDALTKTDKITEQFTVNNTTLGAELDKLGKSIAAAFTNSTLTSFLTGIVETLSRLFEKSKDVTEQFKEQDAVVKDLTKNTVPLINRVDELQKKATELGGVTKLSKEEQVELNKAIVTIGNTIPGAITQFDAYGNAIGISTQKAREFIDLQQTILKEKNRDAIKDQQETLRKLQVDADAVIASLNKRNEKGNLVKEVFSTGSSTGVGSSFLAELTPQEIQARQQQLAQLQDRIKGIKGIIDELNGSNLKIPEAKKPDAASTGGGVITDLLNSGKKTKEISKDFENLVAKINEELAKLTQSPYFFELNKILQERIEQIKAIEELGKKQGKSNAEIATAKKSVEDLTIFKIEDLNKRTALEKPKPIELPVKPKLDFLNQEDVDLFIRTIANRIQRAQRDEFAKASLDVLTSDGKQKLEATIRVLDLEKQKELEAKDLTENEKLLIEEQYREKRKQAEVSFIQEQTQNLVNIIDTAGQAVDVLSRFSQIRNNKENAALKKELDANELRKKGYQNQLDSKLISQADYDRKVNALDKESAAKQEAVKKQQFERDKKFQLAGALISGAKAIISGFATAPFIPAGLIAGALATALTAAQVAVIASQKYAGGGKVEHPGNGRITKQSNIPAQSNGDDVLATVKRGEVILNKRQQNALGGDDTFRRIGVPGFAGGGTIRPGYETRSYSSVNFPKINKSYEYLRYADGGKVGSTNDAAVITTNSDPALLETLQQSQQINMQLIQTVGALHQQLQKPIKGDWNMREFDNVRDKQQEILNRSVFR